MLLWLGSLAKGRLSKMPPPPAGKKGFPLGLEGEGLGGGALELPLELCLEASRSTRQ